ncbi:MAG TPA: aspartate aminotransferase family protein [Actinomycetota bacterium]|nr:aspartate aminotransferase family protein [Actinomycetota bacterium]
MSADIDGARVEQLTKEQVAVLAERWPRSLAFAERAGRSLAGGVSCAWHALDPYTLYGDRGEGAKLWDIDGNEYVDLHNGYGVTIVGHAHPKVVEAVRRRVVLGTHFALPTEDAVVTAEYLQQRFGLPLWRFKNTGSEATMDAVRIMRAATGSDLVIKVEGAYHGSADGLAFSYWIDPAEGGPRERPVPVANTGGIPSAYAEPLRIVSFNDLAAVERILADEGDRVAGMILEPIMMNSGVILPDEGYLASLRDLLHRHGALLTFDEVKTGVTIAPGGAVGWSGVTPDLVTLAKAIGGGIPISAIGGTEDVMRVVSDGTMEQEGTFNANPLSVAAARVVLGEILTPDVYERFDAQEQVLAGGIRDIVERYDLPATVASVRCRGSVHFRAEPVRDFRDHTETDDTLAHLAWLYQLNGGVFPPAGDPWTFSLAHTDEDLRRSVGAFERFAADVTS